MLGYTGTLEMLMMIIDITQSTRKLTPNMRSLKASAGLVLGRKTLI